MNSNENNAIYLLKEMNKDLNLNLDEQINESEIKYKEDIDKDSLKKITLFTY